MFTKTSLRYFKSEFENLTVEKNFFSIIQNGFFKRNVYQATTKSTQKISVAKLTIVFLENNKN